MKWATFVYLWVISWVKKKLNLFKNFFDLLFFNLNTIFFEKKGWWDEQNKFVLFFNIILIYPVIYSTNCLFSIIYFCYFDVIKKRILPIIVIILKFVLKILYFIFIFFFIYLLYYFFFVYFIFNLKNIVYSGLYIRDFFNFFLVILDPYSPYKVNQFESYFDNHISNLANDIDSSIWLSYDFNDMWDFKIYENLHRHNAENLSIRETYKYETGFDDDTINSDMEYLIAVNILSYIYVISAYSNYLWGLLVANLTNSLYNTIYYFIFVYGIDNLTYLICGDEGLYFHPIIGYDWVLVYRNCLLGPFESSTTSRTIELDLIHNFFNFSQINNFVPLFMHYKLDDCYAQEWVSVEDFNKYFSKYNIFKNIEITRFFIISSFQYIWCWDFVFLHFKYLVWLFFFSIDYIIPNSFCQKTINSYFFLLSDISLLELSFKFKNQLIGLIDDFFDAIFNFSLIFFLIADATPGVVCSQKQLLYSISDYNIILELDFVYQPVMFYFGELFLYDDKDADYTKMQAIERSDFLVGGTPFIDKTDTVNLRGLEDLFFDDILEDTEVIIEPFSLNYFNDYFIVNPQNIFYMNDSLFNSLNSNFFFNADNIFEIQREFTENSFFGIYEYGNISGTSVNFGEGEFNDRNSIPKINYEDLHVASDRITKLDLFYFNYDRMKITDKKNNVFKTILYFTGPIAYETALENYIEFVNFGQRDNIYVLVIPFLNKYTINILIIFFNFFFSLLNICINFLFLLELKYLFIISLIFLIIFLIIRGFFLCWEIDIRNQFKQNYFNLSHVNSLYDYNLFIENNEKFNDYNKEVVYMWTLKKEIYDYKFLFSFKFLKKLIKRILQSFKEFFFYILKVLNYSFLSLYQNINIKFFNFIYLFINKNSFIFTLKDIKQKLNFKNIILLKLSLINITFFFNWFFFKFISFVYSFIVFSFSFFFVLFLINLLMFRMNLLEELFNYSLVDFYPTYISLFLIIFFIFLISIFNKNLSKQLLGSHDKTIFLLEEDDFDLIEDDDIYYTQDQPNEQMETELSELPVDFKYPTSLSELLYEADLSTTDIGENNYEYSLFKRFEIFASVNETTELEDLINQYPPEDLEYLQNYRIRDPLSTYLYIKDFYQYMILFNIPEIPRNLAFYNYIYHSFYDVLVSGDIFEELILPEFTDIDVLFPYGSDKNLGLMINPIEFRTIFQTIDDIEPSLEEFSELDIFNEFLFEVIYDIELDEKEVSIFVKESDYFDIYREFNLINDSINLLELSKQIFFFKKIGDFNNFMPIKDWIYDIDDDFQYLLYFDYNEFFRHYYIGFQLNLGFKDITMRDFSIQLLNPYEMYDNVYKRIFYYNLNFYIQYLNLKMFPYITNYDFQRILIALHCNKKEWEKINCVNQEYNLHYPFYDFPIFVFIAFHYFLGDNLEAVYETLDEDFVLLIDEVTFDDDFYLPFELWFDTSDFLENFFEFIDYIFEMLLLSFSMPGYLHENLWRYGRDCYFDFYFIILLIDFIGLNNIFVNTVFYDNVVWCLLHLWIFFYRIGMGYFFYDLFYLLLLFC